MYSWFDALKIDSDERYVQFFRNSIVKIDLSSFSPL